MEVGIKSKIKVPEDEGVQIAFFAVCNSYFSEHVLNFVSSALYIIRTCFRWWSESEEGHLLVFGCEFTSHNNEMVSV